jgi:hypothetical protein
MGFQYDLLPLEKNTDIFVASFCAGSSVVEQEPFKLVVVGSIPTQRTKNTQTWRLTCASEKNRLYVGFTYVSAIFFLQHFVMHPSLSIFVSLRKLRDVVRSSILLLLIRNRKSLWKDQVFASLAEQVAWSSMKSKSVLLAPARRLPQRQLQLRLQQKATCLLLNKHESNKNRLRKKSVFV